MSLIVLSHALHEDGMALLRRQPELDIHVGDESDTAKLLPVLSRADAFILRIGKLDRSLIEQCPNLKVITRPGVGVDAIDVAASTQQGIPVVVTPGANVRSVAEHTLTLLLALAKNTVESHNETKGGNFFIRNKYAAIEVEGKRIGVLGYGAIGRQVARLCALLGMDVSVYDPFVSEQVVEKAGYQWCSTLQELLPDCDFITLHMPSTPQTKWILDQNTLSMVKEGAFLINCARGDLVDEEALFEALSTGRLAGAGADMMAQEPMDPGSPLFSLPHFIASPHMAALTRESASRCAVMAVEGTLAILRGERWPHVFDSTVYEHPKWNP